jgi:hypothetical protein
MYISYHLFHYIDLLLLFHILCVIVYCFVFYINVQCLWILVHYKFYLLLYAIRNIQEFILWGVVNNALVGSKNKYIRTVGMK